MAEDKSPLESLQSTVADSAHTMKPFQEAFAGLIKTIESTVADSAHTMKSLQEAFADLSKLMERDAAALPLDTEATARELTRSDDQYKAKIGQGILERLQDPNLPTEWREDLSDLASVTWYLEERDRKLERIIGQLTIQEEEKAVDSAARQYDGIRRSEPVRKENNKWGRDQREARGRAIVLFVDQYLARHPGHGRKAAFAAARKSGRFRRIPRAKVRNAGCSGGATLERLTESAIKREYLMYRNGGGATHTAGK